jgi:hypothetical protein
MQKYITSAPEIEVTNRSDAGRYKEQYDMDEDIQSVTIKEYSLFDNILSIIFPSDSTRFSLMFCKDDDLGIFVLEFDGFRKLYTIYGESDIQMLSDRYAAVSFYVDAGRLVVTSDDDFTPSSVSADVVVNAGGLEGYIDCSKNKMLTREGNVLSVNYAGNLLNYTL